MNGMRSAAISNSTYENVSADCPNCGRENTFNRISDLGTSAPISGRRVTCEHCTSEFWIWGDQVNNRHETLIFDCHPLIARKQYMNCILTLAQAHEVFFNSYFQSQLLYKPFVLSGDRDVERFNRVADLLHRKFEEFTFGRMRSLFLRNVLDRLRARDLSESESCISEMKVSAGDPCDAEINQYHHHEVAQLLRQLKTSKINVLRNDVVHKHAYRPSLQEVKDGFEVTKGTLLPLAGFLGVADDWTWFEVDTRWRNDYE